jgi:hypothetical protein
LSLLSEDGVYAPLERVHDMIRKFLLGTAVASQALAGAAVAAPARPQAVSFAAAAPVAPIAAPVRAASPSKNKGDLVGVPFLLPLLGAIAVVVVVAVVASGGDSNSSPN